MEKTVLQYWIVDLTYYDCYKTSSSFQNTLATLEETKESRERERERERCLDTIKTKKIARSGFNTNQQTVTTKKI